MKENGIPEDELCRAKDQVKGNLMLSLESSTSRMSNLARQEMYFDRFFGLDEIIERIEAVTAPDLQALAQEYFQHDRNAVTVLGNLDKLKISCDSLACSKSLESLVASPFDSWRDCAACLLRLQTRKCA